MRRIHEFAGGRKVPARYVTVAQLTLTASVPDAGGSP